MLQEKDVILVDDIVDTAGTLTKAAELLVEKGANSVRAFCTHAVLSGKAYETIENSKLTELIVTDTIPLRKNHRKLFSCPQPNCFRMLYAECMSIHPSAIYLLNLKFKYQYNEIISD